MAIRFWWCSTSRIPISTTKASVPWYRLSPGFAPVAASSSSSHTGLRCFLSQTTSWCSTKAGCRHLAGLNRCCPCLLRLSPRSPARKRPDVPAKNSRPRPMSRVTQSIRRHVIGLGAVAAFIVLGIGVMGAATDMSGAIISSGSLVVESNLKKVQHPAGGVAKTLLVEEGGRVRGGDLLIQLDETVAQANLSAVTKSLWELEA